MASNNLEKVLYYRRDPRIFYNVGLKHAAEGNFGRALKFLYEAVNKEPYNSDYQFNLACVQAELKENEKSNNTFLSIIKNIDPTLAECYFGIACNFFHMENLDKAREYLEKYVLVAGEDEYLEIAYDILYYLQLFENDKNGSNKNKIVKRLLAEGKRFLNTETYDKACLKLERAVETDPLNISARNFLALACFFNGNVDRAINIALTVLKLENRNIEALCSLTVFYAYKSLVDKCMEQLKSLSHLEVYSNKEFMSLLNRAFTKLTIDYSLKKKIIKVLKLDSSHLYTGKDETNKKCYELSLHSEIKWRREWEEIIQCAVKSKESTYGTDYRNQIEKIWMNYIRKVYPENLPSIRKREVWAAALEYIYCNANMISVTKKGLSAKYNISISSITNKVKTLK